MQAGDASPTSVGTTASIGPNSLSCVRGPSSRSLPQPGDCSLSRRSARTPSPKNPKTVRPTALHEVASAGCSGGSESSSTFRHLLSFAPLPVSRRRQSPRSRTRTERYRKRLSRRRAPGNEPFVPQPDVQTGPSSPSVAASMYGIAEGAVFLERESIIPRLAADDHDASSSSIPAATPAP